MAVFANPPHPHVPGQTPRHPEDLFALLCQTARPGMAAADLFRCDAWRAGLQFFAGGFYWEAHEVWEAVWMAAAPDAQERRLVRGMIQLANAALKQEMARPGAVLRLCAMVEAELNGLPEALLQEAGLSLPEIREQLAALRAFGENTAE